MYYGGNRSYGKNLSYNFSSDLSLSSFSPRNPSIQRVLNTDYGSRDRSLSPSRDYSSSRALSSVLSATTSPTFRRREFGETERSSPVSLLNDRDFSIKPRSFYEFSSTPSTLFTSYSSPIKKPKRTDYTDYLRPVLTARPMLRSGYVPRSRNERESISSPLVRERKLIKFREISDEVLEKIRRRISWDLPAEEINSPLINEMREKYEETAEESMESEQCSSRRSSKDLTASPISGSPRHSISHRSSCDQTQDKLVRPPVRKNSRSNSLITSSIESVQDNSELKQDDFFLHSKVPIPPPRKKSIGSSIKGRKSRKSSLDILLSEEKTQNYSKIAEGIKRSREIAESMKKLTDQSIDENSRPPQEETEITVEENKLSSVSEEDIVVPDRSRRRRRISIPEPDIIEEPTPEVRRRVRSRFKSRETSESISPSAELKTKSGTCEEKSPRITSRMHRKSVKYKSDNLQSQKSLKCTEKVLNSTIPPLQELSSLDESKSNLSISENKTDANYITDKKDSAKKDSKAFLNEKEISETKIKQGEKEIEKNAGNLTKSKLEKNLSSATAKLNDKYLEKNIEQSKEKIKNKKMTEKSSEIELKANKVKNIDPSVRERNSDLNITKISPCENESKDKTIFSNKITETQRNNLNKVTKKELNILTEKDSNLKISITEKKDDEKKLPLNKNIINNSEHSKNACDTLLKKETFPECSKAIDKSAKSSNKGTDFKNFPSKEIPKSEEKDSSAKFPKNVKEKKEEKLQSNEHVSDFKKPLPKNHLDKNSKSIQKEQSEHIESKLLQNIIPNEVEEVVIVCKLPKKNELELIKNIPKEQNIVVSIKNSELKTVENKSGSAKNNTLDANKIIPTGSNQISTLQNCDSKKNRGLNETEATDVNITHTVVLKPKASEVSTPTKIKTGKDIHLKSIPDVIKSTVNCGSKENNISDVVKSTLSKTDSPSENENVVISGKSLIKSCEKIANDVKKSETLAPVIEKVVKDRENIQLKQPVQKTSTSKDMLDIKKSSSAIFGTTKETLGSSNIKKSNSDILDESKIAKKPLAKPDLIEMTTNKTKTEKISNLAEPLTSKKVSENNSSKLEIGTTIAKDSNEFRTKQTKEKNSIENTQNKITSISNEMKGQSNSSSQQLQPKLIEKNSENNAITKTKIEFSDTKRIQKDATFGKVKSESENKSDVQITGAPVFETALTKNSESKDHSKFSKDLTKTENKNIGLKNLFPDHKNVKHTALPYKKSVTLPNVNTILEECNNSTEKSKTLSKIVENELSSNISLSTDNVTSILHGEKVVKKEKSDAVKSLRNEIDSLQTNKKSVDTQLPKINCGNLKQDIVKTEEKSKINENKLDSAKLINKNIIKESKIQPNDSETEKSTLMPKLNGTKDLNVTKIKSAENKLVEKVKESSSNNRDTPKNIENDIASIQRAEKNKQTLPPEVLKLPLLQNTSKPPSQSKQNENVLPQISNKKLDTTSVTDINTSLKNEFQASNLKVDENCKIPCATSESKQLLDQNSTNIDSSVKPDLNANLEKPCEEQKKSSGLKEGFTKEQVAPEIAKNSAAPKPNRIKQPKVPQYQRYGLFIRPKEPPKPILESSSSEEETSESDTETESSSEDETPVVKKNNITNGKYPERSSDYSPKKRSHSETSTTSVNSNSSVSTTCTTIQEPWDESPKTPNQRLKFRKYGVDDFTFLKLLGKGSFGKVLLAELKNSNLYFAIKCLKKDVVLEDDDVESTMIERRVLALGTQHPYMCKLYCTFQTKSYLYFVMEYLNGGDLMFHIQENGRFEEKRAVFYGAEIVSALKFLHKRGIVYRDIKLDNLMLDQQGHIRLVDFGMCQCRIYKEECMPSNFCGTPTYIAPEIVLGQKYNQSVDWWSFGVLLYEMLIGRSPFQGTDEDELFWSICNEEPHYPRFLSKEATHILGLLLVKSPSKRLGMPSCPAGDIKDHAFFKNIDWSKIENKEIAPAFKPSVSGPCDTSNFDSSFTLDSATLSPVDSDVLKSMDQEQFNGFSYTNPHLTG